MIIAFTLATVPDAQLGGWIACAAVAAPLLIAVCKFRDWFPSSKDFDALSKRVDGLDTRTQDHGSRLKVVEATQQAITDEAREEKHNDLIRQLSELLAKEKK